MNEPVVHVFASRDALCSAAAAHAAELMRATPPGSRFSLALSGGSTPRPFHHQLATTHRDVIPWDRVHIFWGDERFVPPNHADSNMRMAEETLLRHIPIPEANIHRVHTDQATPARAAADLETELNGFFPEAGTIGFDLMIMGLGEDGHTASLFPGDPVLHEQRRWAAVVMSPPDAPARWRITLTLPLINQSKHIFFLVSGEEKREPLNQILRHPEKAAVAYPAARVKAREPVVWYVDSAAYGEG